MACESIKGMLFNNQATEIDGNHDCRDVEKHGGTLQSSCRYAIPRAAPAAILILADHSKTGLPCPVEEDQPRYSFNFYWKCLYDSSKREAAYREGENAECC